ncbi:hypothetical protein FNU76_01755 [Chitinimonas arctica]|uniref:Uncharacterized protein n=1 Tax=Chitinimonas arctica TaxID=2594795 RepID=A0A516SAK7_9NEIS|nr:hypothetical protein FNU76_01755 [Chitinimonas arctica]
MKTCMIYGDMSSDRAGEQYPSVPVCDKCASHVTANRESSCIVNMWEYDPSLGDACEFCGETIEDEATGNCN